MIIVTRNILSVILGLSTIFYAVAGEEMVVIHKITTFKGESIFQVPQSLLHRIPVWNGKSRRIPVKQEDAIRIFQDAAKAEYGFIPKLREIILSSLSELDDVYAYQAAFDIKQYPGPQSWYLLLLDGTIIRPTINHNE